MNQHKATVFSFAFGIALSLPVFYLLAYPVIRACGTRVAGYDSTFELNQSVFVVRYYLPVVDRPFKAYLSAIDEMLARKYMFHLMIYVDQHPEWKIEADCNDQTCGWSKQFD